MSKRLASLAAVAAMAMGDVPIAHDDYPELWTPCGTTNAKRPPRKHSTHKQNARKARKGRK